LYNLGESPALGLPRTVSDLVIQAIHTPKRYRAKEVYNHTKHDQDFRDTIKLPTTDGERDNKQW